MAGTFEKELAIAQQAAQQGAAVALSYWRKPVETHTKSNERDPVTEADLASDAAIRAVITDAFPEHDILSEEIADDQVRLSDWLWVIDPIDGTVNFTMGEPIFGVSVGLLHKGVPVVGVIAFPVLEETYWATHGGGAFFQRKNGDVEQCHVSSVAELHTARFAGAHYYSDECRERFYDIFPRIAKQVYASRIHYCGTYDFMYIARGGLDLYINLELALWDYAAAGCIITEAGGRMTDGTGNPLQYTSTPQDIIASNTLLASTLPPFFSS